MRKTGNLVLFAPNYAIRSHIITMLEHVIQTPTGVTPDQSQNSHPTPRYHHFLQSLHSDRE